MTAPLTPANVQAEPSPGSRLCRALGGCLGDGYCCYCGAEMPAELVVEPEPSSPGRTWPWRRA